MLGDDFVHAFADYVDQQGRHIPVVAANAAGECSLQTDSHNIRWLHGRLQGDDLGVRGSISPGFTAINIRHGLSATAAKINSHVKVVPISTKVIAARLENKLKLVCLTWLLTRNHNPQSVEGFEPIEPVSGTPSPIARTEIDSIFQLSKS